MSDEKNAEETPEYCNLCGDPLTGSDLFCAGCGAKVGHVHEEQEADAKGS